MPAARCPPSILSELRGAEEPLTSRDIATAIISLRGDDPRDRRYMADLVRRVGNACRALASEERIRRAVDAKGNVVWAASRQTVS